MDEFTKYLDLQDYKILIESDPCERFESSPVSGEWGCSIPIRFITDEGFKTMMPGKRYDENLNEISE